ncbi:MAG: 50S ribosomal protein L4, partial [Deltaproteobacteria bacterium]|nr:50S ribosomal protein L4 [Deltaproteobacteria bacterium]
NIPNVKVLPLKGINVYDLLKYEYVIIKEPAVGAIEERLQP